MKTLLRSILLRLHNIGGREQGLFTLLLDLEQIRALEDLALRERQLPQEVASILLGFALAQRSEADQNLGRWRMLTPREQEITALVSRGYTNREIAERLVISPETVKTHINSVLRKYGLGRKHELRQAMSEWDFSAWERGRPQS